MVVVPTDSELQSILATEPTVLDVNSLQQSGFKWTSEHINALHVHIFDSILTERFFPEDTTDASDEGMSYTRNHRVTRKGNLLTEDLVYLELRRQLVAPSYKDLRLGPWTPDQALEQNIFASFFREIWDVLVIRDEGEGGLDNDSDPTGSSHEDAQDIKSRLALVAFIQTVLRKMGYWISPTRHLHALYSVVFLPSFGVSNRTQGTEEVDYAFVGWYGSYK